MPHRIRSVRGSMLCLCWRPLCRTWYRYPQILTPNACENHAFFGGMRPRVAAILHRLLQYCARVRAIMSAERRDHNMHTSPYQIQTYGSIQTKHRFWAGQGLSLLEPPSAWFLVHVLWEIEIKPPYFNLNHNARTSGAKKHPLVSCKKAPAALFAAPAALENGHQLKVPTQLPRWARLSRL